MQSATSSSSRNLWTIGTVSEKGQSWLQRQTYPQCPITSWTEQRNFQRWLKPAESPDRGSCDYRDLYGLKRAVGG